jgi:hypothetical protein
MCSQNPLQQRVTERNLEARVRFALDMQLTLDDRVHVSTFSSERVPGRAANIIGTPPDETGQAELSTNSSVHWARDAQGLIGVHEILRPGKRSLNGWLSKVFPVSPSLASSELQGSRGTLWLAI